MKLSLIDQVVLFTYLGGIVIFGCYFSYRNTNSRRFMDAGGSLPGWVVGFSVFGTFLSSISFLANPGKSFDANWNPFVFGLSLPIAALIATKWFVPFYRKQNEVSAYAHFQRRFGRWAKYYAILFYVLTQIMRIGTIIYLIAMAVEPITGWNVSLIIIALGIAVIVYTLLGGIEAVIWTDVVQSIVLTVGILVAIVSIFLAMPEGPKQVFTIAHELPEESKFSFGKFTTSLSSLTESTIGIVFLYGLFINLQNFGIDQSYVQRYATAKDEKAAKQSVWLGCWLYIPISALLFFVGTSLYAFYEVHPQLAPEGMKGDSAFGVFIANQLPVGFVGLMVAAILAAGMSSVDSSLNACATLICNDIAPDLQNDKIIMGKKEIESRNMLVLRATTIVIGILGVVAALAMIGIKSSLDNWWKLASIFSGGVLGLFLLGILSQKVKSNAAFGAVILGLVLIFWMTVSSEKWWPASWQNAQFAIGGDPISDKLIIVFGTSSIVLSGFLLSLFVPGDIQSKKTGGF